MFLAIVAGLSFAVVVVVGLIEERAVLPTGVVVLVAGVALIVRGINAPLDDRYDGDTFLEVTDPATAAGRAALLGPVAIPVGLIVALVGLAAYA